MPSPRCPRCSHVTTKTDHTDASPCQTCGCTALGGIVPGAPGAFEIPEDAVPIGGHQNAEGTGDGMTVYRTSRGIIKVAQDEHNAKALANEAHWLRELADSGFTPALLEEGPGYNFQEDHGEGEPCPTDGEEFRRNMIDILWTLRQRGVRHGDITSRNLLLRDSWPTLIDWQEAHAIGDPAPQKSPYSDSHLVLRTIADWTTCEEHSDPLQAGIADTPRIARRWRAVLEDQYALADLSLPLWGKTFLDLGCYRGDFVALAAAEGMRAWGIDAGGMDPMEDCIAWAQARWAMGDAVNTVGGVHFDKADIMDLHDFSHDIVIMFSTFSYLVRDHGFGEATAKVAEVVRDCGTFYFENQLYGDGPGPSDFRDDDRIGGWLGSLAAEWEGEVRRLATIPVTGRAAARTVWRVDGGRGMGEAAK